MLAAPNRNCKDDQNTVAQTPFPAAPLRRWRALLAKRRWRAPLAQRRF
jgi:uncharacterized protein YjiS (DUF1127 family)